MQINHSLQIVFPDDFREMSREEYAGLLVSEGGEGTALKSETRHLIVTLGWKKAGAFSGLVLNAGDLLSKMEQSIRKAMKHLDYREDGPSQISVGNLQADGFRYSYTAADGTQMAAESYVLKKEHTLYYFHLYSRKELLSENSGLVRGILQEAQWTG